MRKHAFKNKVYILFAIIGIFSLIVDAFNIVEINRYNGLMAILSLTILVCGIRYRAALKGLDTMLSINRDYKVRQLWSIENQFDWKRVSEKHIKWAKVLMSISLLEIIILVLTGDTFTLALIVVWAITVLLYAHVTRPLEYPSK
ncbi:hypothetical protein [Alkalibacterium olivapovliticus]|uniref:Uncharacterized protein n=1 Tax=Alkalibacterium olivapovliticus TaxID=99907 RepID=A0A2T0VWD8_9LACT|nr:hypothetical protein [Alkalibacterium olivapovliticus]PRY76188.1 hypothetical protein CLV38_13219 [Alkalibacterium olivapovliticus]